MKLICNSMAYSVRTVLHRWDEMSCHERVSQYIDTIIQTTEQSTVYMHALVPYNESQHVM